MTRGVLQVGKADARRARPFTATATFVLAVVLLAANLACSGSGSGNDSAASVDADASATTSLTVPSSTSAPASTSSEAPTTTVDPAPPTPSSATSPPATRATGSTPTTRAPSTPPPVAPPGDPRVSLVSAAQLGASWHAGCPVGPSSLRRVSVTYRGFDGADHVGDLIVHADAVTATLSAFDRMHAAHFPIRKVLTVDHYGASDDASMADDNTSAFNCRPSTGSSTTWSQHAYGRAIDINPLENPYVSGSSVQPPAGSAYLDRSDVRPGMAVAGGAMVAAFAGVGWGWGGSWSTVKDYQHVSATGR